MFLFSVLAHVFIFGACPFGENGEMNYITYFLQCRNGGKFVEILFNTILYEYKCSWSHP